MASRTLPLLYLNLGGEMMYVLDQRLVAQKVDGAKAAKGQLSYSTHNHVREISRFYLYYVRSQIQILGIILSKV